MRVLRPFIVLVMLLLAACAAPAADEVPEPTATELPTELPAATPQPSPPLLQQITPEPSPGTPAAPLAARTPSAGTPIAKPTLAPVTPVASPTPVLGAGARREATELSKRLDQLMVALKRRNSADLVRAQQDLRDALDRTDAALKGDKSPQAKELAAAADDLRGGLGGDLPKLDAAQKALVQAVGAQATASGTPKAATPTVEPIADLDRFGQKMSKDLASFQEALAQRDAGRILSLQSQLLDAVARANASLEGDTSAQAEKLRAAAGAVKAALSGDEPKYTDAQRLLAEASASSEVSGVQATPGTKPTKPTADVAVLAQNLDNGLAALRDLSTQKVSSDESARRRKELDKQIAQAEQAIAGNPASGAKLLQQAIGVLREASAGDTSKLDRAETLLRQARDAR